MGNILNIDLSKGWHSIKNKHYSFLYKGYLNNIDFSSLFELLIKNNFNNIKNIKTLKSLDGHFCLILLNKEKFFIAGDRISSISLIIRKYKNSFLISDNYKNMQKALKNNQNLELDSIQAKNFAMSGYTFGESSLFKKVFSISPGIFYTLKNNKLTKTKYYDWKPFVKKKYNDLKVKSTLQKINESIISKLVKSCNQRCIVLAISAGYDSRLILSGLIKHGYKNIITFSYGRKKNRDQVTAKKLTTHLKVPWIYIEYNNKNIRETQLSKDYEKFKEYCDLTNSVHFTQDYFAIKFLKKNKLIPKNSIIINGQTGDFLSGNHIPFDCKNKSYEKLLEWFLIKHYTMSKSLYAKEKEKVKKQLNDRISSHNINNKVSYDIYESLQKIEYEDRQAKYVVSGQRVYEYFGYEWRLPLWDLEYITFWEKVPTHYKINQSLYKEVIYKQNWSNAWKIIPVNPSHTFSYKIIIFRLLFKCLFIILGKDKWHKFERKFLDYFISPLCEYSAWPYLKLLLDNRGFKNSISWHMEKYLNEKKITWEGSNFK